MVQIARILFQWSQLDLATDLTASGESGGSPLIILMSTGDDGVGVWITSSALVDPRRSCRVDSLFMFRGEYGQPKALRREHEYNIKIFYKIQQIWWCQVNNFFFFYLWWPVYLAPLMWPMPLQPGIGQPVDPRKRSVGARVKKPEYINVHSIKRDMSI